MVEQVPRGDGSPSGARADGQRVPGMWRDGGREGDGEAGGGWRGGGETVVGGWVRGAGEVEVNRSGTGWRGLKRRRVWEGGRPDGVEAGRGVGW